MTALAFLAAALASPPVAFTATAYTADCAGCSGWTATGIQANAWGPIKLMAIDPDVLRLGRCYRLHFTDARNDGHTSVYLAADTGPAIQGRRVDLLLRSTTSARRFGRQHVEVEGPIACPVDPSTLPRHR